MGCIIATHESNFRQAQVARHDSGALERRLNGENGGGLRCELHLLFGQSVVSEKQELHSADDGSNSSIAQPR